MCEIGNSSGCSTDINEDLYISVAEWVAATGYASFGFCSFLGNTLMLIPILYHEALRLQKEYILVAGMAFGDAVTGLAYFIAGCYRIPKTIAEDQYQNPYNWTGFNYALMPWNLMWVYVYPTAGFMLTLISFDRFLVTVATFWYINQSTLLWKLAVALAYLHSIIYGTVVLVTSYLYINDIPVDTDNCYQSKTMFPILYTYLVASFNWGNVGNILVMAATLFAYCLHNYKVAAAGNGDTNLVAAKQQRDMTRRFAWSTFFTLVLVVIPVYIAGITTQSLHSAYNTLFYVPNNLNPCINVYIFLVKHPLLRKGLVAAFQRKKLPQNLKNWMVNPNNTSVAVVDANRK